MAKVKRLNSMRLLDANSIAYEVYHYDAAIRDARQVAAAVGFSVDEVFKTLVVGAPGARKPVLVMLPSNTTLDLKRLAKAMGRKKAALASHADAEKLTGLQVGGISALALMGKNWDVYLDRRAEAFEHIVISAGQRGLQLRVETAALMRLLGCRRVDVAAPALS
ncbi:MAG: aminoacyl-tRNA deacylase [Chloroflexota bacterium]|nr:aminoacyl-tRNA deacylase [Chloroflexota bacterium]MDE2946644.1 aminoacyl-tRNA deacylase [Chloroflexota bacterium]